MLGFDYCFNGLSALLFPLDPCTEGEAQFLKKKQGNKLWREEMGETCFVRTKVTHSPGVFQCPNLAAMLFSSSGETN